MDLPTVKDIMVPLDEYATVSEDATLVEAIRALEKAQERYRKGKYLHRAVLVLNSQKQLVGKLSQHDVIRALEPNYQRIVDLNTVSRFGIDPIQIETMVKDYGLWNAPLPSLCHAAARLKVKEVMYTPVAGEYIEENAFITVAFHRLVVGSRNSLLVTDRRKKIVGVLKLTDVFALVCRAIETC
jgi:CBS-domain-containing membrane protein